MSGGARLSTSNRSVELGNIDRLSNAMTHRLMVAVGFDLMVRESLDASIEAPKVPARFTRFETLTTADIDHMFS